MEEENTTPATTTNSTERNTARKPKVHPRKKWGRYYGIIISALLFLLLDATVFLFNIYISDLVEENAIRVNIAARQGALIQASAKYLLQIKDRLEEGKDIEFPLAQLKAAKGTFEKVLKGFHKGAYVPDGSGQPVLLERGNTKIERMLIEEAVALYQPILPEINEIVDASTDTINIATVQKASEYMMAHSQQLADIMDRLTYQTEKIAEEEIDELRLIQAIGIVLALLNFVFLLAHFVARLTDRDNEIAHYSNELEEKIEIRTKEIEEQKMKLAGYSHGLEHLVETKTRELRESEEKYRSIFESFPDIYYRADLMGKILAVSPSVQFHTGFAISELEKHPSRVLFESAEAYEKMLEVLRAENNISKYEIKVRKKGGGYRDMTMTARVLYDENLPVGIEGILHDITQERQIARKLQNLNQELSSANESLKKALALKKEFLAIASHDLKNPISAIQGVAKLMEMEGGLSESQTENVDMVKSTATYMLELIEQLVTNAMLDEENVKLTRTDFNVGVLIDEVLSLNTTGAKNKGQKLQAEIAKDVLLVGDRHKIREAVDNLISNAVKYAPFDSTIYIRLKAIEGHARFEVVDQGPGLTEDDKKKVFGKFQKLSASPTGDESSSGLGLNIVKRIIELHNGTVGVESQKGKGATFYFALPLQPVEETATTSEVVSNSA